MKITAMSKIILAFAAFALPALAQAQVDDSINSDAHITSQRYVSAEVIRVSPRDRTITVRGETRGQTRQFTVPEGTRISIEGREARLRDLRYGDQVTLSFLRRQNEVVVEQIRVPDAPVSLAERRTQPTQVVSEARPAVLPSTASFVPAAFVFGLFCFAIAGLIRRVRA